jgi:hypothetical protein
MNVRLRRQSRKRDKLCPRLSSKPVRLNGLTSDALSMPDTVIAPARGDHAFGQTPKGVRTRGVLNNTYSANGSATFMMRLED